MKLLNLEFRFQLNKFYLSRLSLKLELVWEELNSMENSILQFYDQIKYLVL